MQVCLFGETRAAGLAEPAEGAVSWQIGFYKFDLIILSVLCHFHFE